MKRIITVQDISCVGKCSLTVALPVISAMGVEACVLPTAVLSTHTAFKGFTFRDLTGDISNILDSLGGRQMDIAEATFRLTAPDELFAGIDFEGITTQTPTCELQADIIDDRLLLEFVGNPGGRETTVVLPFRQLVVIIAT